MEGRGDTGMGHRSAYAPRTRQDWLAIHILIDKYIYIILYSIYIYIYELYLYNCINSKELFACCAPRVGCVGWPDVGFFEIWTIGAWELAWDFARSRSPLLLPPRDSRLDVTPEDRDSARDEDDPRRGPPRGVPVTEWRQKRKIIWMFFFSSSCTILCF